MKAARSTRSLWWHLAIVVAVSASYESLFIHHGINRLDEGWPLYAGMQLQAGGRLYEDILWVFPPGHAWVGWFAYAFDPPGIVAARWIYAFFNTAACVGIYLLARGITTPPFALLGALLVALAAPRGHLYQVLFGYRYVIFSVMALLAFSRRLRSDDSRWMIVAGGCTGLALMMRLTPAFSVSCGIAVAVLAADPRWRVWVKDWSLFGLGLLIWIVPILLWFAQSVGLPAMWREVVVHPLGMLQPLPLPEIHTPAWGSRRSIYNWFVAVQFRTHWFLYGGYALALFVSWLRARRQGRRFEHPLLVAVVVWGGVFFIRSLGRSDEPHLDSVIPPICLLGACLVGLAFERSWPAGAGRFSRAMASGGVVLVVLSAWVFLLGTDLYFSKAGRGNYPVYSVPQGVEITSADKAADIDRVVSGIQRSSRPGDRILCLAPTPLFHVLTGREGPGYVDVVMPGIFPSDAEETRFLERLEEQPPAAVVWPVRLFDRMPERSVSQTAPRVTGWIRKRYRPLEGGTRWIVLVPIDAKTSATFPPRAATPSTPGALPSWVGYADRTHAWN